MSLEISGKVIAILAQESGQGKNGEWKKQSFVIETSDEKYPKKVCITAWNDLTADVPKLGVNAKVSFNAESREYNGKWYTELKAWKIQRESNEPLAEHNVLPQEEPQGEDNLPF